MALLSPAVRGWAIALLFGYLLTGAIPPAVTVDRSEGLILTVGVAALCAVAGACFLAVTCPTVPRWPTAMLLVILAVGVAQNLLIPLTGIAAAMVLAWVAPFVVGLPVAVPVVVVNAAGCFLVLTAVGEAVPLAFGIGAGVVWAAALATLIQQLLLARRRTDVAAEARAAAAVLAERQRMAREMHDLLAHTLSAQIVHLEGARMLMERGDRLDQAQRQVVGALRLARDGLQETTRALAALRGEELRVVDRLSGLVADFRASGRGRCELDAGAEPESLGIEARWAIVRTAQEALTNVYKHADGADVAVRLAQSDRWCELEITDTGGSHGPLAESGAGFGLTGMRERAELIGGSLEAGRCGAGFQVWLRVPLADPVGARR